MLKLKHIALLLSVFTLMWSGLASSRDYEEGDFDSGAIWPLCGHVSEKDGTAGGWGSADCPQDRYSMNDLNLSSTFGPRQKGGDKYRYDFHRGLDIPAMKNANSLPSDNDKIPVFAITDGWIYKISSHTSEDNGAWVRIRHKRPRETRTCDDPSKSYQCCKNYGCYYSVYMHMDKDYLDGNDNVLETDDDPLKKKNAVQKGQFLGYLNVKYYNDNGGYFPHLHFEIRNSPLEDRYSAWQRDAIHPLRVLPYSSDDEPEITLGVDVSKNEATVGITTTRIDVVSVELDLYDISGEKIDQLGNTENKKGYNVNPSWFDMEEWNFQYSHKNGGKYQWASFGEGGDNECPYYHYDESQDEEYNGKHGKKYDPNVHLDLQYKDDNGVVHKSVGHFNGVRIAPGKYNTKTDDYTLTLTFEKLTGLSSTDCIVADVYFATGDSASKQKVIKQGGTCPSGI